VTGFTTGPADMQAKSRPSNKLGKQALRDLHTERYLVGRAPPASPGRSRQRRDYNEERPHSAIGNKAPIELIDRSVAYGPP